MSLAATRSFGVWATGLLLVVAASTGLAAFLLSDGPKAVAMAVAVGLVGGIGCLWLALRRFAWFVLVLIAFRPLVDVFNLGGLQLLNPSVALGVVFTVATSLWLYGEFRSGRWVANSPLVKGLAILLAAAAASCLVSARPLASIISTVKLSSAILMFVLLEQCLRSGFLTREKIMGAFAVAASCVGVIAAGQTLTGTGVLDPDIGQKRTYLPFVHPNVLAKYLVVVALVGIAYLLFTKGPWRWRRHLALGLALIGVALVGTYARVGWATFAIGLLYLLGSRDRRTVPLALVALAGVVMAVPSVYDRIAELWSAEPPAPGVPGNSLVWRLEYWQHLLPLARMSPINGLGYDTIQLVGGQDLLAHNVWVQSYVEMGLFGVFGLLTAIGGIALTLWQTVRSTPKEARGPQLRAAVAVALVLLIMLNTENLLAETTTLWYAAVALTCGYAVRQRAVPSQQARRGASPKPVVVAAGVRDEVSTEEGDDSPRHRPFAWSGELSENLMGNAPDLTAPAEDGRQEPQVEPPAAETEEAQATPAAASSGRSLASLFFGNMLTSGGTIVIVFFTGVITARMLSTDGRGEVAAITAWILTLTWASSLGFPQAMAYYVAKRRDPAPIVVSTLFAALLPLGLFGVTVAQLLLPLGFSAQSEETQQLARIMFCGLPAVVAGEAMGALLAGLQLFPILNRARLAQPALYLVGLLSLWATGTIAPWTVLVSQLSSYLVVATAMAVFLIRRFRPRRGSRGDLVRRGLNYGLRQQGVALGELVTGRLDLMMLPAYVTTAMVGFYSIAVNVTSMVMSVFGSLAIVVFPMAASGHSAGDLRAIHQGFRVTFYGGLLSVLLLAGISPVLISTVYGHEYLRALPALWLLLPGVVVWSCAGVLGAGLQAIGQPGRASMAQFAGVGVTVLGLFWALPRYGIEGAAAVSSLAYGGTFLVVLILMSREPAFSLRQALSPAALVGDIQALGGKLWGSSHFRWGWRGESAADEEHA